MKRISLVSFISGITFIYLAIFIAIGSVVFFRIVKDTSHNAFKSRLESSQNFFTDSITNDLLSGANTELYRKCMIFSSDPTIVSIEVKNKSGDELCNFSRITSESLLKIRTSVYFDENKQSEAGWIEIKYSLRDIDHFIYQSEKVLFILILTLIVFQFIGVKLIGEMLARPFNSLAKLFEEASLERLLEIPRDTFSKKILEFSVVLSGIEDLSKRLDQANKNEIHLKTQAAVAETAAQVSHDIRSPLASLISIVHSTQGLKEETRIEIKNAVNRIRDIANNLLNKNKSLNNRIQCSDEANEISSSLSSEQLTTEMLSPLIDLIVSEKRRQIDDQNEIIIDWESIDSYGLFGNIQKVEFGRIISNLLNNSIEALGSRGKIRITLNQNENDINLIIADTGKGMPPEILEKLGQLRVTHGKEGTDSGSGLGTYHAFQTIINWGGTLKYESEINNGTQVTLSLPLAQPPLWFLSNISIETPGTVIILDDNEEVHELWKKRFNSIQGIVLLHFYSPEQIIKWYRTTYGIVDHPIYLCDYKIIGTNQTGFDVIEMLCVAKDAVLVTSRWDESPIQSRCSKLGIKLIPKLYVPVVEIQHI